MLLKTRDVELRGTSRLYKRLMEERLIKSLALTIDTFPNHDHFSIFLIKITSLFIHRVFYFYWLFLFNINFKFQTKKISYKEN